MMSSVAPGLVKVSVVAASPKPSPAAALVSRPSMRIRRPSARSIVLVQRPPPGNARGATVVKAGPTSGWTP